MALIKCSECGRLISDQAASCVGCGAPVTAPARTDLPFNLEPVYTVTAPLTKLQLRRRMRLAGVTFIAGMLAAAYSSSYPGNRLLSTAAALLLISGLCWLIVSIVQNVMSRK